MTEPTPPEELVDPELVDQLEAAVPERAGGPSLRARLVRRGFRVGLELLRSRGGGAPTPESTEDEMREYALALRAQLEEGAARIPAGRHLLTAEPEGLEGLWVSDRRSGPAGPRGAERVVMHLHGGAYLMGSPQTHRGLAAALSRSAGGPVLLPRYRLAPESVFPAALDDAVAAYRWLLEHVPAERIAVSGDSAGGGLALTLLTHLHEHDLPQPAAYVGFSPWTDLAVTGTSVQERNARDPWLDAALVEPAARAYAGDIPLHDPRVSPLYGDLAQLPPTLVHVGSEEILFDDAARLVARAREAGVDASLGRFDGLWHVFQAFPLPEARWSLREAGAFVRRHTGGLQRSVAGTGSSR